MDRNDPRLSQGDEYHRLVEGGSYNEGFREGVAAGVASISDKWPGINASADQVLALVKAARAVLAEDCGLYAADALAEALKPFEQHE